CPIRTRGRLAWPAEAQETTTPVAGLSLQVRWTCSGVPSLAPRDRRARVPAFAGLTVAAASRPVPPAPASTWRRDIPPGGFGGTGSPPKSRGGLGGIVPPELAEFSGTMEKLTPESEHRMAGRDDRLRHPMNYLSPVASEARPGLAKHSAQDLLDLVEVLLAAYERRGQLDHRVAAVVGPADQPGIEQRLGQEPAQQPLGLLVGE